MSKHENNASAFLAWRKQKTDTNNTELVSTISPVLQAAIDRGRSKRWVDSVNPEKEPVMSSYQDPALKEGTEVSLDHTERRPLSPKDLESDLGDAGDPGLHLSKK